MIIVDDGRFAKYGEGWREFVLHRWRPRDLAEVRLDRGCRLGLTVDDAIGTSGGDGASQSVFDGKISTMSSFSSSSTVSSLSSSSEMIIGGAVRPPPVALEGSYRSTA